mmetsp:Transcript_80528/g.152993  ORF Transcript_80528/g.152993 Transcript_80528/m.152993 type:complete len:119 (+) Transcript_80528:1543-1899(+)
MDLLSKQLYFDGFLFAVHFWSHRLRKRSDPRKRHDPRINPLEHVDSFWCPPSFSFERLRWRQLNPPPSRTTPNGSLWTNKLDLQTCSAHQNVYMRAHSHRDAHHNFMAGPRAGGSAQG